MKKGKSKPDKGSNFRLKNQLIAKLIVKSKPLVNCMLTCNVNLKIS